MQLVIFNNELFKVKFNDEFKFCWVELLFAKMGAKSGIE
jgi:hypothetical protein